jgi:hypothetical protein
MGERLGSDDVRCSTPPCRLGAARGCADCGRGRTQILCYASFARSVGGVLDGGAGGSVAIGWRQWGGEGSLCSSRPYRRPGMVGDRLVRAAD